MVQIIIQLLRSLLFVSYFHQSAYEMLLGNMSSRGATIFSIVFIVSLISVIILSLFRLCASPSLS